MHSLKAKLIFFCAFCANFGLNISQECNSGNVKENPICSNPQRDLNFDAKWVHDNAPPEGWSILYGSPVVRRHFSQLLLGREIKDDEDLTQLCLKTVFDSNHEEIGGIYQGFGNLQATRKCFHNAGDKIVCQLTSSTNSSYTEKVRGHVAYVDKRNFRSYHVGVACYENGDFGWLVNSIKRNLTSEDKETIQEQLRLIGFNPEEQVQFHEDSC